jgi:hypothetical protein
MFLSQLLSRANSRTACAILPISCGRSLINSAVLPERRSTARSSTAFEALLDCIDPGLFNRIIGGFAPPKEHPHDVMCLLRGFAPHHRRKN